MSQESLEFHTNPASSGTTKDVIILVFVHGFKGNDSTFVKFPERLQNMLSESLGADTEVDYVVFPAYETRGELPEAVVKFADWLTNMTVEKEAATGLGSGSVKIILCGHSMGGLLIVDTLLEFAKSRKEGDPLWPKIVACLAYDTPYYGLHPHVFKNSANKAAEHVNAATTLGSALLGSMAGFGAKKASDTPSKSAGAITAPPPTTPSAASKWSTAAYAIGGALAAGAAAGSAYWKKDDIALGYTYLTDHFKFVGKLWDEDALKRRMRDMKTIIEQDNVVFRNFYTFIPAKPPAHFQPRTFIVVPTPDDSLEEYFVKSQNHLATDELAAHTGMFSGGTNGGFFELGLNSGKAIQQALHHEEGGDTDDAEASSPVATSPQSPTA